MFDSGRMTERKRVYPSDMSDAEWAIIEPLLPPSKSGGFNGGRPPAPRRPVVDAILYLVRTGCSWRQLPADFPKWQTVYFLHATWVRDGTLDRVHDRLRDQLRVLEGRDPEPTVGIIDSQSVRGATTVGWEDRGWDGGKKINGRKRHIVVDTLGLLLAVAVTAASVQDRDGGLDPVEIAAGEHPQLTKLFADGGYAGRFIDWVHDHTGVETEIVKRSDIAGFVVLPKRWIVERTFGWLITNRRLAADYERNINNSEAITLWAMIGLMTRRIARTNPDHDVTAYNW